MIGLETDHVISGSIRGPKINWILREQHSTFNIQSDGHRNSLSDVTQRAESVKTRPPKSVGRYNFNYCLNLLLVYIGLDCPDWLDWIYLLLDLAAIKWFLQSGLASFLQNHLKSNRMPFPSFCGPLINHRFSAHG